MSNGTEWLVYHHHRLLNIEVQVSKAPLAVSTAKCFPVSDHQRSLAHLKAPRKQNPWITRKVQYAWFIQRWIPKEWEYFPANSTGGGCYEQWVLASPSLLPFGIFVPYLIPFQNYDDVLRLQFKTKTCSPPLATSIDWDMYNLLNHSQIKMPVL